MFLSSLVQYYKERWFDAAELGKVLRENEVMPSFRFAFTSVS